MWYPIVFTNFVCQSYVTEYTLTNITNFPKNGIMHEERLKITIYKINHHHWYKVQTYIKLTNINTIIQYLFHHYSTPLYNIYFPISTRLHNIYHQNHQHRYTIYISQYQHDYTIYITKIINTVTQYIFPNISTITQYITPKSIS